MAIIGLKDAAVYGVQVNILFLTNFEILCPQYSIKKF
jgi:hypothetical protein